MANKNIYPSLCLTLDGESFSPLLSEIGESINKYRLNVVNLGWISDNQIFDCYASSSALIFPSLFESFGLPLVEANGLGLPILAPERDYVRDVVRPIETFDPSSPVSISRAVMRFLEVPDDRSEFVTGKNFIKNICNLFSF